MRLTGSGERNSVSVVQNTVPVEAEVAQRALASRLQQYEWEVRRLVDAAFEVMSRTGDIDPQVRDIVKAAGLSNQVFYRHFASKDALMVAVLADGQRQLVEYLRRKVSSAREPRAQVSRWIEGLMAQARSAAAADRTRPFAVNGPRLADRFPDELASSRSELVETLAPAVQALDGSHEDAAFICDLALARMNDAIAQRRRPHPDEIRNLIAFCIAGTGHRADAAQPAMEERGSDRKRADAAERGSDRNRADAAERGSDRNRADAAERGSDRNRADAAARAMRTAERGSDRKRANAAEGRSRRDGT